MTLFSFYIPRPRRLAQKIVGRFVQPQVDLTDISMVLSHFGLELTGAPRNVVGSPRNRNLIVPTSAGIKLLKRYRQQWPLESIRHEHSILNRLSELDFAAPRLCRTPDAQSWASLQGGNFALTDYIDGTYYASSFLTRSYRRNLWILSGVTLANLHKKLEGFLPQGQHHLGFKSYSSGRQRNFNWYVETIGQLKDKTQTITEGPHAADARWLVKNTDRLTDEISRLYEDLDQVELPRLIIHGDYGLHNMLFHENGSATVLDFELARLEWRLSDLVMYLSRFGFEKSRYFLEGYHQEFPISTVEWDCLLRVWQLRSLQSAVQKWKSYFELDAENNLAKARSGIESATEVQGYDQNLVELRGLLESQSAPRTQRIFMITRLFYPWIGGTERQAHKLASKLAEKGVPVEIVTGQWFQGTLRHDKLDGVPIYRNFTLWGFLGIKGLRKFGGYLYMITLMWYLWRRRADYDLIHVHGLNYHTAAAVAASQLTKRPVVVKLANSGSASDINKMRRNRQLALSQYMLPTALKSDRFIALHETINEELVAAGVPRERIVNVVNGVEIEQLTAKTNYALHRPGRFIYVGRLHPQKGLDILLGAFAVLLRQYNKPVCLQLVGDGPISSDIRQLAIKLGIHDQVEFLGKRDDVPNLLAESDIFVLPSFVEGLSNALLEAMACGLPAIASDIPGNAKVIRDDWNGLLFTTGDVDSLVKCMNSLLESKNSRQRLGRSARNTVEQSYSLDNVADRYISLYQELLGVKSEEILKSAVAVD